MLPTTEITRVDGGTGVVRPAAFGVLAILACASAGDLNIAESFSRMEDVRTEYETGHLPELASYVMPRSKKPIVAVRGDPATAGDYSAITKTGGGTSVVTEGATEPVDEFDVVIEFTVGATIGVAGAKYKYSLNGGKDFSKVLALGTAAFIVIPDTGIRVEFAAGTVVVGETLTFTTTGPKLTNADLTDALENLRVASLRWDALLIDMEADADTVTAIEAWLPEMQKKGRFPTVILTTRPKGASETEAQYLTAMTAIAEAVTSLDIVLCADRGDLTSAIRKIVIPRPTGLAVATRGMELADRIGTDPAWVELGPTAFRLYDDRGQPKYHDENNFPGLDDLKLTTLRTIDGFNGVYITNANIISPEGSDYVYWQHTRCINRGCEISYAVTTKQLSRGVKKNPEVGQNGERYIDEAEAQKLEELMNAPIRAELVDTKQVDDMRARVSRTDDIRSNQGAEITVTVESVSLGYIKKFKIFVGFVTAIESTGT